METLSSSEQASIESGSDTERFTYRHEYSLDNGVTWKKVEPGEDLLELIGKGANKIRAIPSWKGALVKDVEDWTPENIVDTEKRGTTIDLNTLEDWDEQRTLHDQEMTFQNAPYDEREEYVIKDLVPQSDPNEPLPYEIYDARVNSDGTLEKVSDAEDYKVLSCGFGSSGYSPGGVSWIPATASQERKAKWRKRFRMKGRKNV